MKRSWVNSVIIAHGFAVDFSLGFIYKVTTMPTNTYWTTQIFDSFCKKELSSFFFQPAWWLCKIVWEWHGITEICSFVRHDGRSGYGWICRVGRELDIHWHLSDQDLLRSESVSLHVELQKGGDLHHSVVGSSLFIIEELSVVYRNICPKWVHPLQQLRQLLPQSRSELFLGAWHQQTLE